MAQAPNQKKSDLDSDSKEEDVEFDKEKVNSDNEEE